MPNRRMYQVFLRAYDKDMDRALIAEIALFECHSWSEALKKKAYYQETGLADQRYHILTKAIEITWGDCTFDIDIRS